MKTLFFIFFTINSFLCTAQNHRASIYIEMLGNNGIMGINGEYRVGVNNDLEIGANVGYAGFLGLPHLLSLGLIKEEFTIYPLQANLYYKNFGDGNNNLYLGSGSTVIRKKNRRTNIKSWNNTSFIEVGYQRDLFMANSIMMGIGGTFFFDGQLTKQNTLVPLAQIGKIF